MAYNPYTGEEENFDYNALYGDNYSDLKIPGINEPRIPYKSLAPDSSQRYRDYNQKRNMGSVLQSGIDKDPYNYNHPRFDWATYPDFEDLSPQELGQELDRYESGTKRTIGLPEGHTMQRKPVQEKFVIKQIAPDKKRSFSLPNFPHLINKITRPGANLSFAGDSAAARRFYPSGAPSRGGLYATEVANMQKLANMGALTAGGKDWISGKNVVSGFGDYNKGMQKNLERFEQTAEDKGYKDLDELAAYYKRTKNKATLQRLKHAQRMTGGIDGGGDGKGGGKIPPPGSRMDQSQYDNYMEQHDLGHGMNIEDRSQIADTWAQGGRVGYNTGGRVGILSVF